MRPSQRIRGMGSKSVPQNPRAVSHGVRIFRTRAAVDTIVRAVNSYGAGWVLARIHSFILVGIEPLLCEVECDVSNTGLDTTTVTGLPQTGVKESVEREVRDTK